jgi:hypothetical protein
MAYVIIALIVVAAVLGVMLWRVRAVTGNQPLEGETPERSDARESPRGRFAERDDPGIARPVVGGEAEGERSAH